MLWAERNNPLTDQAKPRESHEETTPALPNGNLLELVRFLARAAAETDFQEQMKGDGPAGSDTITEHGPQKDP
ncbi:MAG: hypothetical protein ACRBBS_13650 [Thalassovita sp.]